MRRPLLKPAGLAALFAAALLWGCGQKGPLYLPDKNPAVVTAPPSPPATAPAEGPAVQPQASPTPPPQATPPPPQKSDQEDGPQSPQ